MSEMSSSSLGCSGLSLAAVELLMAGAIVWPNFMVHRNQSVLSDIKETLSNLDWRGFYHLRRALKAKSLSYRTLAIA